MDFFVYRAYYEAGSGEMLLHREWHEMGLLSRSAECDSALIGFDEKFTLTIIF